MMFPPLRGTGTAPGRWVTCLFLIALSGLIGCGGSTPPTATPPSTGTTPATPSSPFAEGESRRIILITNGDSPFWGACAAGLKDAQTQLSLTEHGYQAVMEVNDGTLARQLEQLRQFGSQSDVAGIGISVIDAANASLAEELRTLKKKGIAVITFDSDVDRERFRDARTAFIGTDNRQAGITLGQCAKQLQPSGKYVTFVGLTSAQNAIDRIEGFGTGAGTTFESLDNMPDDFDQGKARENVRNAIRNHPELNLLVGIYSYNAPAITDVVKEQSARERFKVIAFDAEKGAIRAMSDGMIDALVVQNPYQMGYQGVRILKAIIEDDNDAIAEALPNLGQPDGDIYDTGLKVVVPDAKSPVKPGEFGPKTEFLLLPDFLEWLKKYNLTDS